MDDEEVWKLRIAMITGMRQNSNFFLAGKQQVRPPFKAKVIRPIYSGPLDKVHVRDPWEESRTPVEYVYLNDWERTFTSTTYPNSKSNLMLGFEELAKHTAERAIMGPLYPFFMMNVVMHELDNY